MRRAVFAFFFCVAACRQQDQPNAQMRAVLDELKAVAPVPIEQLSPQAARQQASLADAVRAVATKQGKTFPEPIVRSYDEGAGDVSVRIYQPSGERPFPVVFYIHGGGWVVGTLDSYDASARALANATQAIVVSAHYRQAPEFRFPTSHDDVYASYQWTALNIHKFGGDPARMAVAGESAGANMALDTALRAKTADRISPVALLLVYPVAGTSMTTTSYRQYAEAQPLGRAAMDWFLRQEVSSNAELTDVRLNAVGAAPERYRGLPPTTMILAEIDPLRSEGETLGTKLREARVETTIRTFPGVTHDFLGTSVVVDEARHAIQFAAEHIKPFFGEKPQ